MTFISPIVFASLIPLPESSTVTTEWFLAFGCLSAFIFGMGKVGFGGGVSILAVPIMIFACGSTKLATGLMLPLLITADYMGAITWWGKWDFKPLRQILPGTVFGIIAGSMILWRFGEMDWGDAFLKLCVGSIAGAFVVLHFIRKKSNASPFRPTWAHGTIAGLLLGICSTLAHAAGPIAAIYLLTQELGKQKYVATTIVLFWLANQIKLIPYGMLGMINTNSLTLGLWLIPAVLFGAIIGKMLNRRIGDVKFTGIIYTLLTLTAIGLIWDAIIEFSKA